MANNNAKPQFSGEWVRLGDAFELRMGKTPSRKNMAYWRNGKHDWVSIADLGTFDKYVGTTKEQISDAAIAESRIKPAPANTVLMSFKLSIGKVAITRSPVFTNEAIMALVDRGKYRIDPTFIYHQCKAKDWTAGSNTAVMGKTLNKKTLSETRIYLPGFERQIQIAAELDYLDEQIALANAVSERLDSLVKSRFNELFGKVAENNLHFPVIKLDYVCTSIVRGPFGSALKKEFFVPKGPGTYKVYEQKHAIQKQADIGIYYIDGDRYESLNRFECHPGDILMSCSGTMGELYQLPPNCEPGVINQALCKFSLSDAIQVEYFLGCMNQIVDQLGAKGSGIKNVSSVKFIKAIEIPLPPITLQRDFATFSVQVDKLRFMLLGNPSPIYRSRSFC